MFQSFYLSNHNAAIFLGDQKNVTIDDISSTGKQMCGNCEEQRKKRFYLVNWSFSNVVRKNRLFG